MEAVTALQAMPSARNIDIYVNDDWALADWGSIPSARRYWARRGAAECGWPAFRGCFLEAYVAEYMVSEVLRGAYLHRMGNYCVCEV